MRLIKEKLSRTPLSWNFCKGRGMRIEYSGRSKMGWGEDRVRM